MLEQTGELDTEAKETAWAASELQGGVASLETSLGAQPKVLGLTDSVADQPKASAVLEAAGVKPESLLGLQLRREVLNPAYEKSAPELMVRMADLAAAKAKSDTLRAQLRQNTADAVALQRQLAERELELEARELRYTIAKGTYEVARSSCAPSAAPGRACSRGALFRQGVGGLVAPCERTRVRGWPAA